MGGVKFNDISGQRFGKLTAVEPAGRYKKTGALMWKCVCDCGKEVIVRGACLRQGNTRSCGCLNQETRRKTAKITFTKHGGRNTRLYNIWKDMRQRCHNENSTSFGRYGGRGVSVCKEWEDFQNFRTWAIANGYGDDLTIDRIEVNGNYEPGNCRWVDNIIQGNNKRNNPKVAYRGKEYTIPELSRLVGIPYATLRKRIIYQGWSVEDAISIPVKVGNNQTLRQMEVT